MCRPPAKLISIAFHWRAPSTLRRAAEQRLAARPMAHFERSVKVPHGMFKNVQLNRQIAAEPSPATQKAASSGGGDRGGEE